MRLPLTIVAASLTLCAGVAHAQAASAQTTPPTQTAAAGRVSARLPITPQPAPDQRLERIEAALVELDTQLRGLKAQGETSTGLNADQVARLEDAMTRLQKTQETLDRAMKKLSAGEGADTADAR